MEIALFPSFLLRLPALQPTPAIKNNIGNSNELPEPGTLLTSAVFGRSRCASDNYGRGRVGKKKQRQKVTTTPSSPACSHSLHSFLTPFNNTRNRYSSVIPHLRHLTLRSDRSFRHNARQANRETEQRAHPQVKYKLPRHLTTSMMHLLV